ncbi:alpha/beta hydrolase [bacterium]|nr:alpha/beta hydrolase [bacterium]MBU1063209.1 alpha/beta hydrolase [bacterium]MBU1635579.1 alpha/beta hydrolase [bacterium]MBU1873737.1 alpha/beta hydrolase [bacterium]
MQSLASIAIKSYLKIQRALQRGKDLTLSEQRKRLEHFAETFKVSKRVQIESTRINQISAEWITPDNCPSNTIIMYMHGGAYCAGSLNTHRAFLGRLAMACKCKVFNIEYRLAPEYPYPAALNDVFAVYNYLMKTFPANKIVFAGDSAGGGLAVALAMRSRDDKIALPAACILMAPWVDLSCDNATYQSVGKKDVLLNRKRLKRNARIYAGPEDIRHSYISPVYGNLSGLPPVLIQVGTHDMLLGEAQVLSERLESAGTAVSLEVWPKMMHGWQVLGNLIPESRQAIQKIAEFIIH